MQRGTAPGAIPACAASKATTLSGQKTDASDDRNRLAARLEKHGDDLSRDPLPQRHRESSGSPLEHPDESGRQIGQQIAELHVARCQRIGHQSDAINGETGFFGQGLALSAVEEKDVAIGIRLELDRFEHGGIGAFGEARVVAAEIPAIGRGQKETAARLEDFGQAYESKMFPGENSISPSSCFACT